MNTLQIMPRLAHFIVDDYYIVVTSESRNRSNYVKYVKDVK